MPSSEGTIKKLSHKLKLGTLIQRVLELQNMLVEQSKRTPL
jgi:hypothetical protein